MNAYCHDRNQQLLNLFLQEIIEKTTFLLIVIKIF